MIVQETSTETFNDPLTTAREPAAPQHPHLILALECERPQAGAARYSLAGCDEVVIGRGAERSAKRSVEGRVRRLTLLVPDRRMSSVHGRLTWQGDQWLFEDLQSRNGSQVNGAGAVSVGVGDGDWLQLGHAFFLLREDVPTPPGTPDDVDQKALAAEPIGMRTLLPVLARELRSLLKVARSEVSVLLVSETGTGKEMLAQAAHVASERSGDLVAINCGAIASGLVESTLFGHVKGAFSGAVRDEVGLVRAAERGTLFLDEVGELPRPAQAALLRVLQEREVVPVGGTRPNAVDIRVIAATHRPLEELVARGEFRSDLLARLGGLCFRLPALRQRREDIGLLIAELLPRFPGITGIEPAAARALLNYDWPHNVRELEKVLSLSTVLAESGQIRLEHLPEAVRRAARELEQESPAPTNAPETQALRAALIEALETHGGNVTHVARSMGKARQQIHRWLTRLRIDPAVYRRRTGDEKP